MNTFNQYPDTLLKLTCKIIDSIEEILSASLSLTCKEICEQLENNLSYSLSHIRDIFKFTTKISLVRYKKRRKYTIFLSQIEQICKQAGADFMKSYYEKIINGRTIFEIKNQFKNIIIQTSKEMLVDLEKTYFLFEDKVFRITATLFIAQSQTEDPFLSMHIGQSIYPTFSIPVNTNAVIYELQQYLEGNISTTNSFSILIEWCDKHGWGSRRLISSMTFNNSKLKNIDFVDKPFLVFNNHNVTMNLEFF